LLGFSSLQKFKVNTGFLNYFIFEILTSPEIFRVYQRTFHIANFTLFVFICQAPLGQCQTKHPTLIKWGVWLIATGYLL